MIKILTIIGARPQIIKSSAISRAIRNGFSGSIEEIIVHTGQHYDKNMSEVFFSEMEIPLPKYNLGVGSGSHGVQTARMISGIEELILKEKPQAMVLYGDTNSTLAGAIAASKLHCPVVHIEAGLRSFNKSMPEEINRIMCDHVSTLLFSPTKTGYDNLVREGFNPANQPIFTPDNPGIFHCGDVMYDNSLHFKIKAAGITEAAGASLEGEYILVTIHRDHNTDIPENLQSIFRALISIADTGIQIVLPLHPRTTNVLKERLGNILHEAVVTHPGITITEPVSFIEMIAMESNAKMIITDSGGVQKESFFFEKPCIVLRPQTEWTELIDAGTAVLANADTDRILDAYTRFIKTKGLQFPSIYGDGKAGSFICSTIESNFKN